MGELVEFPSGKPIKVEGDIIPARPNSNPHALPPSAVANLTPEEKELLGEHGESGGGNGRKNPHDLLPEAVDGLSDEQRELLESHGRD